MPNHVTNILTVIGPKEDREYFFERIKSSEQAIDFERVLPMPLHIYDGSLSSYEEKKFGEDNCWYKWCVQHWGTKWNAYDIVVLSSSKILFDTAWSTPIPIFTECSRAFPMLTFKVRYADENTGHNCGSFTFKNGVYKIDRFLDDGSDIAKSFARRVHGSAVSKKIRGVK